MTILILATNQLKKYIYTLYISLSLFATLYLFIKYKVTTIKKKLKIIWGISIFPLKNIFPFYSHYSHYSHFYSHYSRYSC